MSADAAVAVDFGMFTLTVTAHSARADAQREDSCICALRARSDGLTAFFDFELFENCVDG